LRPTLDASAVDISVDGMRCRWEAPDGSISVSFNCDDIDRLRALTIDAFLSLPKRGVEIGGFLLGRIDSTDPLSISIEGFEPVPCEHRFGPSYVLSEADRGHCREVFERLQANTSPPIVGFYRTYTAREPALDAADQDLIQTYISGLQNVFLLIRPLSSLECGASFVFGKNGQLETEAQYASFPFRADQLAIPVETQRVSKALAAPPELPPRNVVAQPISAPPATIHQPRVKAEVPAALPRAVRPPRFTEQDPQPSRQIPWFWILLLCLIAITGGVVLYSWKSNQQQTSAEPSLVAIRESAPAPPQAAPQPTAPQPATQRSAPQQTENTIQTPEPPQAETTGKVPNAPWVAPVALHQVQPGIPPGIRARIHDRIIVPVVVHVTASGKVSSAFADGNGGSLYRYLGEQAVVAARLWRFRPAHSKTGTAMEASKTLYFVFTP
jgi:hypothetical protein